MADAVELRMSVSSIKRVDPYAKEILSHSTHVALYKFNPTINEWERTETEGALFLYSRSGEPWHSIMIMNRLNTDNLIEPIVKEFEYQLQPPFLLYRNPKNKIFGIWFYNREECVNITYLLESLMERLKEDHSENSKTKAPAPVDIFSMLSKAQQDFNSNGGSNNKTPSKLLQPQFASTPRAPEVPSQSVMDFFAKAGTKTVKAPIATPENVLQRLMSNPAHSVEHIEKQQRSVTPQDQQQAPARSKSCSQTEPKNPISYFPNSTINVEAQDSQNGISKPNNSFRTSQAASVSPFGGLLMHAHRLNPDDPDVSGTSPLANFLDTPQKPQLMPPMMFASSSSAKIEQEIDRNEVNLLTNSQLSQALIYLLKNDPEFVSKIHEAYTKSVIEKLNNSIK